MKLQQNLFLTFHEASAKKWKKSFYSIFEFLPQYWHLYDMEEPKSESLKPCKLKSVHNFEIFVPSERFPSLPGSNTGLFVRLSHVSNALKFGFS